MRSTSTFEQASRVALWTGPFAMGIAMAVDLLEQSLKGFAIGMGLIVLWWLYLALILSDGDATKGEG